MSIKYAHEIEEEVKNRVKKLDEVMNNYRSSMAELDLIQKEFKELYRKFEIESANQTIAIEEHKSIILQMLKSEQKNHLEHLKAKYPQNSSEEQKILNEIQELIIQSQNSERIFNFKKENLILSIEKAEKSKKKLLSELDSTDKIREIEIIPEKIPLEPSYSQEIPLKSTETLENGTKLKVYESGHYEFISPNSTRVEKYPNGYEVIFYPNGDVKETFSDKKEVYFYYSSNVLETSFEGKKKILYPNGMKEVLSPGGSRTIKYPDGSIQTEKNGLFLLIHPDGTRESSHGESKTIYHPGGHRIEIVNGMKQIRYFNK